MFNKRVLQLGSLLLVLGLVLAACSSAAPPPPQADAGQTASETEAEAATEVETETEAAEPAVEAEAEAETEAAGPPQGGTIIVGLQAEPTTLDAQQISDYNSHRAAYGVYDTLLRFTDESTEVEPGLAESWDISDDGLVYTLHLRQGITFHDGADFNAEAVKFNLERQIDPNHPFHDTGEFAYAEFTWGAADTIEVVDDATIRITLTEPFAPFLNHLAMHPAAMVSPAAVEQYGADISINPVGTGPFKFASWTPGVEVILEKNPDYWRGAPNVDQVIYRSIIEDQSRLTELEAGGINFMVNIPPDDLPRLRDDARFTVVDQAGMHTWWVAFNQSKPPFDNPQVRQAINYAVNKQAIVDNLLQGTGVAAVNPLPPVVWSYTDDIQQYAYDPDKAKELLAEAGYPDGFSCSFWVPESGSGMQQPVAMGTAIQADLAAVGIDCQIETFEWGAYLDKVIVPPDQAEYDMFEMSWIGDNGDPDNHLYILLSSQQFPPQGYNMGFYNNPEVDDLLQEARVSLDRGVRTELYQEAQKLLAEDPPWLIIDHETQIVVMDQKIKNFKLHPTGPFRFENVWIEE
jgi:peptide/nickel transport system substrate-binding protein